MHRTFDTNREDVVCGSLARGKDRPMRHGNQCDCDDGWTGINCNVCTDNKACDPLMETKDSGVCYQMGDVVKQNHQMCDVTNKQILSILQGKIPQVTFSCDKGKGDCGFQCSWLSNTVTPSCRANKRS